MTEWNENMKGINIISNQQIKLGMDIGESINEAINKINNPVKAIVNLKQNPSIKHSHTVAKTSNIKANRAIFINNILNKYPWVEKLVFVGGYNVVVYGPLPFE